MKRATEHEFYDDSFDRNKGRHSDEYEPYPLYYRLMTKGESIYNVTVQSENAEEFLIRFYGDTEKTTRVALQLSANKHLSTSNASGVGIWTTGMGRLFHREGEESEYLMPSTTTEQDIYSSTGNGDSDGHYDPRNYGLPVKFDATFQVETAEEFLICLYGDTEKATRLALQISANKQLKVTRNNSQAF